MPFSRVVCISLVTLAGACGGSQQSSGSAGAQTGSLASSSSISCHNETECAVCYRTGTCGEPIAASDPNASTPACHVSPAPFCMPRRARCEDGHCVAH